MDLFDVKAVFIIGPTIGVVGGLLATYLITRRNPVPLKQGGFAADGGQKHS
jgi:hypothetical protein